MDFFKLWGVNVSKNYENKLFCRGYLITEHDFTDIAAYPSLKHFNKYNFGRYFIYIHKEQHFFIVAMIIQLSF